MYSICLLEPEYYRHKESDKFSKWSKDEDQFHLKQALLRSSIRIQDGRAKPIDLLAKYISAEGEVSANFNLEVMIVDFFFYLLNRLRKACSLLKEKDYEVKNVFPKKLSVM